MSRESRAAPASSHDVARRERRRRCRRLLTRAPCVWLRGCQTCRCGCAPPHATFPSRKSRDRATR
eukprot:5567178-Pleurochrysis_carterae.AAC.2